MRRAKTLSTLTDVLPSHRCFFTVMRRCLRMLRNNVVQTRVEGAHQAFQAINPVERILVLSVGPPSIRARSPNFTLLSSSILWCDGLKRGTRLRPRSHPAAAVSVCLLVTDYLEGSSSLMVPRIKSRRMAMTRLFLFQITTARQAQIISLKIY